MTAIALAAALSFFSEGGTVRLGVDLRAERGAGREDYLPLLVVVLNLGEEPLELTRESFVLLLPDGTRLPAASAREIWEEYGRMRADARAARTFLDSVFARFPSPPYRWGRLDLFPPRSGAIPRDGLRLRLSEGSFGYLYFRPPGGMPPPAGRYQLLVRPRGAEDHLVLDFEIGGRR